MYLMHFCLLRSSMEDLLEKYKDHPTVKLIYFPTEVNRKESLLQGTYHRSACCSTFHSTDTVVLSPLLWLYCSDLEYYYGKQLVPDLITADKITPAVREYIHAMEAACEKNPALLIAHSYSRYLGDLSGLYIPIRLRMFIGKGTNVYHSLSLRRSNLGQETKDSRLPFVRKGCRVGYQRWTSLLPLWEHWQCPRVQGHVSRTPQRC